MSNTGSIAALKTEVNTNIKQNGVQAITGNVLNGVLIDTIDTLDAFVEELEEKVGEETEITATETINGVIKLNGDIVSSSNYRASTYPINPNVYYHIVTSIDGSAGVSDRALVAAYKNGVFVRVVFAATTSRSCDIVVKFDESVNSIKIYSYKNYTRSVKALGEGIISDILTLKGRLTEDEGRISSLEGRTTEIEGSLYDKDQYDRDDLQLNYYYNLTGVTAPSSPTSISTGSWGCNRFAVKAGTKAILSTKGGASGRAYAVTDTDRHILEVADASVTLTNYEITINQDGFLYVNTQGSLASFALSISLDNIKDLDNRVIALEGTNHLPPFHNNPYPINADSLRVLVLGNSFTDDATMYLGSLVNATSIDASKLCVYTTAMSGATINEWIDEIEQNTTRSISKRAGTMSMTNSGTMSTLLGQNWDVIVIAQASDKSYTWATYVNLLKYVSLLRMKCPNQKVCIAFQMAWGHTEASTPSELAGNIDCIKRMASEYGVDYIIPVGMAIQNARGTTLNNDSYMTRDDWHLNYGVGRYVAACSFFQSIIAPVFNVGIIGNSAVHAITPEEESETSVAVTSANNTLCQTCAFYAAMNMFNITMGIQ